MTRSAKTILLWLVLIVMFLVCYQMFSVSPDPNGPARAQHASQTDWPAVFLTLLPIVFIAVVAAFVVRWRQRKHAPTHEGLLLLNQGRYVQALAIFEQYRKDQPDQPAGAFNSGSTRLLLWKLEAALVDFLAAQKLSGKNPGVLVTLLPEHLAITHALLGRVGEAEQALKQLPAGQGDTGRVRIAEAILLTREGDAAGARVKLGGYEVKQTSGSIGAFARTLDAFCVERLTGELRHVDRIALFGETGPEELRKAWPEFIAFVERAPAT